MKRNKWYILCLTFFAMVLCWGITVACPDTSAIAEENKEYGLIPVEKIAQYAVGEDGVWVISGKDVYLYPARQMDKKQLIATYPNIVHTASDGRNLYLEIKGVEEHRVLMMDKEGEILREWKLPVDFAVRQMEISSDFLILLTNEYTTSVENEGTQIYCMDKNTEQIKPLFISGWDGREITAIAVENNNLCVFDRFYSRLSSIDLQHQSLVYEPIATSVECNYIQMGAGQFLCYGLCEHETGISLVEFNLSNGEMRLVYSFDRYELAGLRKDDKYFYIADTDQNLFISYPIPEQYSESMKKITIVDRIPWGSPRMEKARALFSMEHPDVLIVFKQVPDSRMLAAALMSRDSEYDILCTQQGTMLCSRMMSHAGALADLNDFPQIVDNIEHWIDESAIFTQEGKRFGIPLSMDPYVWQVNEPLFADLDLTMPQAGWTWEDFFALGAQLNEINQSRGTHYQLLADGSWPWPYLLKQYNANCYNIAEGTVSYDCEIYRSLMEQWKRAYDQGLLQLGVATDLESMSEFALFQVDQMAYYQLADKNFVEPPVFGEDIRYPVQTIEFVLNSSSDNAMVAADFLACYTSPQAIAAQSIGSYGPYLKNDVAANIPNGGIADGYSSWPSDENTAYWVTLIERGVQEFYIWDIMHEQIVKLYPQFMEGALSLDQFVARMQQQADMALGE